MPSTSRGGAALRNPPGWDKPHQLKLSELNGAIEAGPSPMPATDFTSEGSAPKIWGDDRTKSSLENGQVDLWRVPWWDAPPPVMFYKPTPVLPTPPALPGVLVVPEPQGGEFQFPITYRPAVPFHRSKVVNGVWLEQLAYWEAAYPVSSGDWFRVWAAFSGPRDTPTGALGYRSARISLDGPQPALLPALKALGEYWGLGGPWSDWFPALFGALTIRLADSPELAEFRQQYPPPQKPLTKWAVQDGQRHAPTALVAGDYMPLTLGHPQPCGMCPAEVPKAVASDPGNVFISGEGWGKGTGLTFKQVVTATVTEGGTTTVKTSAPKPPTPPPGPDDDGPAVSPLVWLGAAALGAVLLKKVME